MPLGFGDIVGHTLFGVGATDPADPFRWQMGTRAVGEQAWLQPDDRRDEDLREKEAWRGRRPEATFVAEPGSEAASREVLGLVESDLARRGLVAAAPRSHPLDTAGLSIQEDLCLIENGVLRAASVCFPTRWDVPSKLGRSLAEIHAPVPGYADDVGDRVERFLDRMAPGTIAARLNWSLVDDARRRLEPDAPPAPSRPPADPGRALFVRVERQTLRRLREHDAVVFGIRVHVWSLAEALEVIPAGRLAVELERLPPAVAAYKDLEEVRVFVAEWLRRFRG